MIRSLNIFLFISIACIIILSSCKKEKSCEGCNENNKPPIAVAGLDKLITLLTDSVLLDGSSSNDPDGTINEWLWTKISGPASSTINNATSSRTIVKNLVAGIYQFELMVKDNKGFSDKDTVQVSVDDPRINQPPVANAGGDQTITLPVNSVTVDGSGSTDPDNNIVSYQWTKISGPSSFNISNASTIQTQVNNLAQGVYQFELKVTDAGMLFSKDTIIVTVINPVQTNRPPVANAGPDYTIIFPSNVTIDGSGSSDPDNNIVSYLWTKISGPSSYTIGNVNDPRANLTDLIVGVYQFELKVTDAGGLFSRDTVQITVVNPSTACTDCRIVFVSERDGNDEIYSSKTDGSDIQRLTNDDGHDDYPAWSPDGSKIAFVSDRSGSRELYIMNRDGSNVVRKTFSGSFVEGLSWSPDGARIVYSTLSNGSMNLWVIATTGSIPSLLFAAPGYDVQPAWSPDGNKIALVSDWAAYDFVYDIYTINANGTGFTALTGNIFNHEDYTSPSWSPNGTQLAVAIGDMVSQSGSLIGIMNSNGGGITVASAGAVPWSRTSWSADGTRIAYTSFSGLSKNISWIFSDGSVGGIIVTNGWNADWEH
jgi:Tol biopolymer transport system component